MAYSLSEQTKKCYNRLNESEVYFFMEIIYTEITQDLTQFLFEFVEN